MTADFGGANLTGTGAAEVVGADSAAAGGGRMSHQMSPPAASITTTRNVFFMGKF
jgi:hypothetical protein